MYECVHEKRVEENCFAESLCHSELFTIISSNSHLSVLFQHS